MINVWPRIGGWRGSGRKKKWVSPWLVAVYDPETETFGSVCRVMSGFTDEFYKENTKLYLGAELGGDLLLDVALGRVRRSQQRQRSSSNEPAASESRLRSVGEVKELCKAEQLHFSKQCWRTDSELAYVRH